MAAPTFLPDEIVTAAKLNDLPKGLLSVATITADQTGMSSVVDVTGATGTVTVAASRRIRITYRAGSAISSVLGDRGTTSIKEGSTVLAANIHRYVAASNAEDGPYVMVVVTPSAGAHTYKATYERVAGTGTHSLNASATNPAQFTIEDLGSV